MTQMNPRDYEVNGLAPLLQLIGGGSFYERLNDDLAELVKAIDEHLDLHGGNPAGELTIKIKIGANEGAKSVAAEHSLKLPKKPKAKALLWSKVDGKLSLMNPDQGNLPFSTSIVTIDGTHNI